MFQKPVATQDLTNPVSLPPFYCMQDIPLLLVYMLHFLISHTIGPTDLLLPSPALDLITFQIFLVYSPKCTKFQHHTVRVLI